MRYSALIPAAGRGSRMGSAVPKVLLSASGARAEPGSQESLLSRTVGLFIADEACDQIVVCVPSEWRDACKQELSSSEKVRVIDGGSTRQESVQLGVSALVDLFKVDSSSVVLVHDAARCCLTQEVINRVVEGVATHGAVSAAVPIFDALSRAEDGRITNYVDRDNLWSIQTPQGFFVQDLVAAHTKASQEGVAALDDAGLVSLLRPVHLVMGDRFNIKVTNPDDLIAACRISSKV